MTTFRQNLLSPSGPETGNSEIISMSTSIMSVFLNVYAYVMYTPVSYTHLDVYKRQEQEPLSSFVIVVAR